MAAILIFDPVADSTQLVIWTYMSDKAGVIGIRKPDKKRWEERVRGGWGLFKYPR